MELFEILKFSTRFFLCNFLPIRTNILFPKFMCYWCLCYCWSNTYQSSSTLPFCYHNLLMYMMCCFCKAYLCLSSFDAIVGCWCCHGCITCYIINYYLFINFPRVITQWIFLFGFYFTTCILHKWSSYVCWAMACIVIWMTFCKLGWKVHLFISSTS